MKEWLDGWALELTQKLGTPGFTLKEFWKDKRDTVKIKRVKSLLCDWARPTHACMYCLASEGTDIDHFFPKEENPEKTFDPFNYVLCCTQCGRFKGAKFPLDSNGEPLLINPLEENPWSYIEFDPTTGCLTARFNPATESFWEKGVETNEWLQTENRQYLTDRYLQSYEDLKSIFERFLKSQALPSDQLFKELVHADRQDILEWLLLHNGAKEQFCKDMQKQHPDVWADLCGLYQQAFLTPHTSASQS